MGQPENKGGKHPADADIISRLERELKDQKKRLEVEQIKSITSAKMASLGEMAGGIAHEINNPLAIIIGRTEQLRDSILEGKFDPQKAVEALGKIEATCYRVSNIIKGLRAFSRSGDNDPYVPTPVKNVVHDTLELCRERFRIKEIALKVKSLPEGTLECRSVQLSQVLLNLLNNSFDAVSKLTEKWIEIDVTEGASSFQISVTDSGKGIPAEIATHVMDPFFTTKEIGKGTGLGLSISKGIVEDHHGKFWLDTACGNTRFVMELPKLQAKKQAS